MSRARSASWRLLLTLLLLAASAGAAAVPSAAGLPERATPAGAAVPSMELVTQTATVAPGGTFDLWVRFVDLPDDGLVTLVLHGRIRSRTELSASMDGRGLRSQIYNVTTPIASLPTRADGSAHLTVSLDPAAPAGLALGTAGAYPLEVIAQDAAGAELSTLITHVLVRPAVEDESPPLAVAVVADLGAPPSLRPDGTRSLPAGYLDDAGALVNALAATADIPATISITPDTLDALAEGTDPLQAQVLDALRVGAAERSVLLRPYVDVSPDALADAGLIDELDRHLERGRAVLAGALGTTPARTTWLAGDDLSERGVAVLADRGVEHVVVDPDRLAPLRSGVLSLSLAQPFLVETEDDLEMDAMALDPRVLERLDTSASAGLEVSRILAELAMLWFEQPGIARGVVVPVDTSVRGPVLEGLLAGLGAGRIFQAVELDEVFGLASPLRQPGGDRVDRALRPDDVDPLGATLRADLRATRQLLGSFTTLVGEASPRAEPVAAHVLLATALGSSTASRHAQLDAARAAMDEVIGAVSAPARETITLTARDGTVPLTLRNDAGLPIEVLVRLRSPKLEFPGGATRAVTLTEPTTRLDIAVRTRASGAFPLEVQITSPDGALVLATVDYSVRSTAVSGVGVVLSAGAAVFLFVWWGRHWHRTRRSQKLVAASGSDAQPAEQHGSDEPTTPTPSQ